MTQSAGLHRSWVRSQEWTNKVGYRADIKAVRQHRDPKPGCVPAPRF